MVNPIKRIFEKDPFLTTVIPQIGRNVVDFVHGRDPTYPSKGKMSSPYRSPPRLKRKYISPVSVRTIARPTRFRENIGHKYRSDFAKRMFHGTPINTTVINSLDKTFNRYRLIKVFFDADDSNMTAREHKNVSVIGCTFDWFVTIKASFDFDKPLIIRWAVINPKENDGNDLPTLPNDFFVSDSPEFDRYDDFPTENATPPADNHATFHNLMERRINQDDYGVIQEGKFMLEPNEADDVNRKVKLKQQKHLKLWIPIKRDVLFPSNASTEGAAWPEQNIQFVWWWCYRGDNNSGREAADVNGVPFEHWHKTSTYFRRAKQHA